MRLELEAAMSHIETVAVNIAAVADHIEDEKFHMEDVAPYATPCAAAERVT